MIGRLLMPGVETAPQGLAASHPSFTFLRRPLFLPVQLSLGLRVKGLGYFRKEGKIGYISNLPRDTETLNYTTKLIIIQSL